MTGGQLCLSVFIALRTKGGEGVHALCNVIGLRGNEVWGEVAEVIYLAGRAVALTYDIARAVPHIRALFAAVFRRYNV